MKRLTILFLTCICIKIMLAQPPSWAINQLNVVPGDVALLEIALENASANCTAFQLDLTLPEGISIKKDDEGQLMVKQNDDRISDHHAHVSETLQNTYRIFGYSMNNADIAGSSGTLLTVTLNAEDDIGLGTIEGHIDTGILVADNNEITELETSEIVFQILKKEYTLTYKVDGKNYKSYKMKYGSKITPEAAPEKEGYTFSGWSEIPTTMPAKDVIVTGSFKEITGIISVINDSPGTLIYDMQGRRIDHLQKGLNIIRLNDGKTKKVIVN